MKRRGPIHPKITPVRALDMLRRLERERHKIADHGVLMLLDELRSSLYEHVRAELARRRR